MFDVFVFCFSASKEGSRAICQNEEVLLDTSASANCEYSCCMRCTINTGVIHLMQCTMYYVHLHI